MDFFRFIFSSFWTWLGFTILTGCAVSSIIETAKIIKRGRRVTVCKAGQSWHIAVDNATDADVLAALREAKNIGQEGKQNGAGRTV